MKMLIAGLTGGIVSGKTTVSKIFKELGAEIIDVDMISRQIVTPKQKAWKNIVQHFGNEILKNNQEINRKKLAKIVFSNQHKLDLLNQLTHPEIILEIEKRINQIKKNKTNDVICMIDAPLLFEAHIEKMMDKIIVVYIDREEQIRRLFLRDGLSREESMKRIASQMPIEEKVRLADYVIDNRFSLEKTRKMTIQIWSKLKKALHNL